MEKTEEFIKNSSEEEMEDALDVVKEYTYKLLNYADKDPGISKEEYDKLRRVFVQARIGPSSKKGFLVVDKRSKLTTADVFYILTSRAPSSGLSRTLGVNRDVIDEIRKGKAKHWDWEYNLVKRLKAIVRSHLNNEAKLMAKRAGLEGFGITPNGVCRLSKLVGPGEYKELYLCGGRGSAKRLRQHIIKKHDYNRMVKEGTLDIYYPIEIVEIIR